MTMFTKVTRTYDGTTGTSTIATATLDAGVVEIPGEAKAYDALGLIASETITLFSTPETYGDLPAIGSRVSWAEQTWTVRAVRTLRPDGVTILAWVYASR